MPNDEERKEQILIIFKLLLICICTMAYAWGGMEMKWLRRFLAPALCGAGCLYFSRDWRSLMKMPLLGLASSIGYGADSLWLKLLKRAYVALAFILGANSYEIYQAIRKKSRLWVWIGFSAAVILLAYILLGVWNPLSARLEETILGLVVYTMAIMPVKRR